MVNSFSKIRTAVFSLAYIPFIGGAEVAVYEITKRLRNFDFACFTYKFDSDWPKEEKIGNVLIRRLGRGRSSDSNKISSYYGLGIKKLFYVFRAWREAENEHKRNPFNAIWAIMASYAGMAALLFKIFHPRIPLVLTIQEGDDERHILKRVGIFYPIWRLLFKKADRIQTISNYLKEFSRKHGAENPISVIPNGVDLDLITRMLRRPDSEVVDEIRRVKNRGPIIATTSRLVYKNGIDVLIGAVKKVKEKYPNICCWIIGDGPDKEHLENLTKELGLKENIVFTGHKNQRQVFSYLKFADIFVRASRSEGLGNSFLEAMAIGLPIIGTLVGGIPDFLKDGETGLAVKVGDSEDLAQKILCLIKDDKLGRRLSRTGRQIIKASYDWSLITERMNDVFFFAIYGKKILITTGIYPPDIGGPATYVSSLAPKLLGSGYLVKVLAYADSCGRKIDRDVPIFTVSRKSGKLLRYFCYFLRALKLAKNVDFIYAQGLIGEGLPTVLANIFLKKRLYIKITGDYAWEYASQAKNIKDCPLEFQSKNYGLRVLLLRQIQKFVARRAHRIIVPSNYIKKVVLSWGIDDDKVAVIHNAIDVDGGAAASRRPKSHNIRLFSTGRMLRLKNFDILIKALSELPRNFTLKIVGAGPEKGNLDNLIKCFGLDSRISLVAPVLPSEVKKFYLESDMFILISDHETFPHAIIEAMANGLPVIASNRGGIPEIIDNDINGFLIEPDKDRLREKIIEIAGDKMLLKRVSAAAREKSKKFNWEEHAHRLTNLFSKP